jgi:hypothetical protein
LHAKTADSIIGGSSGAGGFTHYIGEEFGGGVIFHLWKDAQGVEHGLIVDKINLSASQAWSNVTSTLIGSSAQSFWNGLSNSNAIVAQFGHTNSAAALCLSSTNSGFNDWYLPSHNELLLLANNFYTVNKTLSNIFGAITFENIWVEGNNGASCYWSSTEVGLDAAWFLSDLFGSIEGPYTFKSDLRSVRAIRTF